MSTLCSSQAQRHPHYRQQPGAANLLDLISTLVFEIGSEGKAKGEARLLLEDERSPTSALHTVHACVSGSLAGRHDRVRKRQKGQSTFGAIEVHTLEIDFGGIDLPRRQRNIKTKTN